MKNRLYKGKIYLCTNYEEKEITDEDVTVYEKMLYFDKERFARTKGMLSKEKVYLLQVRKNIYVDIDDIQNLANLFNVLFNPKGQDYIDLIYSFPRKENDIYVRKQELKPLYIDMDKVKNEFIRKVKK